MCNKANQIETKKNEEDNKSVRMRTFFEPV